MYEERATPAHSTVMRVMVVVSIFAPQLTQLHAYHRWWIFILVLPERVNVLVAPPNLAI